MSCLERGDILFEPSEIDREVQHLKSADFPSQAPRIFLRDEPPVVSEIEFRVLP